MSTLTGKKALVLGGSRGIGAAIVERLVKDGADTAFTYGGSTDVATALADKTGTVAIQATVPTASPSPRWWRTGGRSISW